MAYKIVDEELDAIVQEWTIQWHEPVSTNEISTGPLVDSPIKLLQAEQSIHDSDGESSTESDPEA